MIRKVMSQFKKKIQNTRPSVIFLQVSGSSESDNDTSISLFVRKINPI